MQGLGTADELRIQVEYEEWRRQPVLERMKSQEEKDATLLPSQGLADIGAADLLVPQVINCYTALSVLGGAASFGVFEVVGKHRVWPTSGRRGAL